MSLLYGMKHVSIKSGYRWVEGEENSLKGPFAAFVLYF